MQYPMANTANRLASKGRYGDSMLMHVNPGEVAGVASLVPGGLTRNPDTGLPEAFLPALLPLLGGIGGTALAGSLGAGLAGTAALGGVGTALGGMAAGEKPKDALMSGMLSGIAGYGLGSLLGSGASGAKKGAEALAQKLPSTGGGWFNSPAGGALKAMGGKGPLGHGALGVLKNKAPAAGGIMSLLRDNAVPAGVGLGGLMAGAMRGPRGNAVGPTEGPRYGLKSIAPVRDTRMSNAFTGRHGFQPEHDHFRGFAEGGPVKPEELERVYDAAVDALLGRHKEPENALRKFVESFGEEALVMLRQAVEGGQVRGAGGGQDDAVPALINNTEPAALSDGEYVVPADVVSHMGDGSTDEGSRRLDEMTQRVRQQKTGAAGMPPKMQPGMMPA